MVRFSDIIKNNLTKKQKAEKSEKAEKQSKPFRLSDLEELSLSTDKKPASPEAAVPEPKKETEEIKKIYLSFQNYINEVRTSILDNKSFKIDSALILINKIINTPDMINELYQSFIHFSHKEDYAISRSINTLVYALKIGQGLEYSKAQLLELGLAALLYDVGMFKIPESIIKKRGELTGSEVTLIRKHPEIGRDILSAFKENYPWLSRVAYEHHERENGQGYPRGIKGDEICEYAKITGIVDTYEAMIHSRPHRKAITQHVSVKELIWSKNLMFSPKIIKALIKKISIYPIGSYVRLNNRAVGMVIRTNEENPIKPAVKLLFNGKGKAVAEEIIIKLSENPLLCIADTISIEEIPH
ncbi:MAG: HD domain-containing protein [Proteobacteria bacterium]|nr:HD domain-containing protein [Pseudomonadota bacterium]MBU4463221.1 HD domain-containing protein [Pseudomonadota bacterium]